MELCLLGTGGMIPLPNRFLASCYIVHNEGAMLIDCGEGTQISFTNTDYDLSKLEILLITHCHADHVLGLPGMLLTLGNCLKRTPLYIVGPIGVKETVLNLLTVCKFLPYEIKFIELQKEEVRTMQFTSIKITSIPLFHPALCFGYSIEIPSGTENTFKISYCTDTRPVKSMSAVSNSDIFICEGMYGEHSQYDSAVRKRHMLFSEAAAIAKQYDVKELWLTHFSPNLEKPEEFLYVAEDIFPNTKVGKDLMKRSF